MKKKHPCTLKGLQKIQKKLNYLKYVIRPKIIQELIEARKHGDLKENAEYHAAKEKQYFYEKKIKYIEFQIKNSIVIDITKINNNGTVIFGSKITIKNLKDNNIQKYLIVGDYESDFKKKLISINSPIIRALIGKKIGDIVHIETPKGMVNYKIINVKY